MTAPIQDTPKKKRGNRLGKVKGTLRNTTLNAIKLSAQYDVPPDEAYQVVTGSKPTRETLQTIQREVEKWSLKHPQALKSASKTIATFAKGKEVNGIKPKDSTVLAAAQRIVDASDPVIKRVESLNVNIQADPVDLSMFRKR